MPKARLVFNGDNVYIEKDARIYGLKDDIASKIDGIPGVIDSLDSTSTTDALSANMGRDLQDQINAMSGIGNFLSTWDCTTGLPGTNPQVDPYTYKVGDYYVVSTVGATNYKPHGGTFTQGVPSTTVETENVGINDKYYFDGADWVRIPNTATQITIDTALSTSSTNAVENRAIANAINTKQDIISDLNTIRSGAAAGSTALQPNDNISELTNNAGYQTAGDVASAIAGKQDTLSAGDGISISSNTVTNTKPGPTISGTAPSNPTEGMLWYDSTNDVLKVYNGTSWETVDTDTNTIYTAGEGIEIKNGNDFSAMRGPCPYGFHIPIEGELSHLAIVLTSTFSLPANDTTGITYLKAPMGGMLYGWEKHIAAGRSYRRCCAAVTSTGGKVLAIRPSALEVSSTTRASGCYIRCFKDVPVVPTSSWVTLYDGSSVAAGAGIFRDSTAGLISFSGDGINWDTLMDKNLGATTVYNSGDVLSEANCGKFYQWGNNYGFPYDLNYKDSSIKVDASGYGPGNYYSNDTFINSGTDWSSVSNNNLWGGETGIVQSNNAIANMGVLSVNGQDGHITIESCNTKTFYLSSTSDLTTAQAVYDWYVAGKNPIIVLQDTSYTLISYIQSPEQLIFMEARKDASTGASLSTINNKDLSLDITSGAVTTINLYDNPSVAGVLLAGVNYSAPYTPDYDGSPATKKYVDDSISHNVKFSNVAPSNPVAGMFWYDTLNSTLSVYDGSAWRTI